MCGHETLKIRENLVRYPCFQTNCDSEREGNLPEVTQPIRGIAGTKVSFVTSQADGLPTPIAAAMISPVPNPYLLGHVIVTLRPKGLASIVGTWGAAKGHLRPSKLFLLCS